jgi:hypothetical protein
MDVLSLLKKGCVALGDRRHREAGLTQVADRVSELLMNLSQCGGLAHGCHSRNKARMIEEKGEKRKKP